MNPRIHDPVPRRWPVGTTAIVAATGPSLTKKVAQLCYGIRHPIIAVNDAWRVLPWAEVLYATDARWWKTHDGVPDFTGEKWTSHNKSIERSKPDLAAEYDLNLVHAKNGAAFSADPAYITYGRNSGFQAINLAMHFGAARVLMVGFDLGLRNGQRHFFGEHPAPLRNTEPSTFIKDFVAAQRFPMPCEVINCTPGSGLRTYPMMLLEDALRGHAPVTLTAAG